MNAIIRAAIENNRAVLTTLVMIFIIGTISYVVITKENNPDIPIPFFQVFISHEGISPEDAERLLVKPMEVRLATISGLKEMRASAREGSASITLEFDPGFDNEKALLDVREAVDRAKSELPSDSEEPIVNEFNAGEFPILTIILSGDAPERTLLQIARNLKDGLEGLPGVLEADIGGDREEVLEVIIDPLKLISYNITQAEILNAVSSNNRLVAAGSLDTGSGRFSVKLPSVFEDARDVLNLPLKTSEDGAVTLGDITDVRRTFKDAFSYARMNGKPAITIDVSKRTGANIIQTSQIVRAFLEKAKESWPTGAKAEILSDDSEFIEEFLGSLQNSVLSAILLVAIVIVAALGLRSAGLVGITIPGSFLLGISLLYFMGYTMNIVVMFGLILAVGLLVDGAIVVSEYADRKMIEGFHRKEAYRLAAQRMAWPITSSTMTTLAAFFPLLLWPGIIGQFMSYLPLTLIFVLTSSLLMALVFLPTVGSLIGKAGVADKKAMAALSADKDFDRKKLTGLTKAYANILSGAMKRPGWIISAAVATLIVVWGLYAVFPTGSEFFPDGEPDNVAVNIHARGNLSVREMDQLVKVVESRIQGINGIEEIYARTGSRGSDVIGRISLGFVNWKDRRPTDDIIQEVRDRTENVPGIIVEPVVQSNGPTSGKDIQIKVTSELPNVLSETVVAIRGKMEEMEGILDINDGRPLPGIEWALDVDRAEAARYGVNITLIGSAVQLITTGIKVAEYRPDDAVDEVDIRVRFPINDRGIEQLDNLRVQTPNGNVPISNFVKRVPKQRVSTITRVDSARVIDMEANVGEDFLTNERVEILKTWIAEQNFDPRVKISFGGSDEQQQESEVFLVQAFIMALFLMGIILITQFNSFYHALLILTAIFLSTAGVVFGILITGRPFVVVMTGVGIISLAGIVVNNNIVLIDTYARLVKDGVPKLDAIIQTGAQRLRPVLLTTITTIIGLMPMVFRFNIDFFTRQVEIGSPSSMIWVDLAMAIAFGLAFATVLTLIVTPCLLALPVKMREKRALRREKRQARKSLKAGQMSRPMPPEQAPAE